MCSSDLSFERLASEGKTPLCFMKNGRLAGMIAVADTIKETIEEFAAMNPVQVKRCRTHAENISRKALWSNFIVYYEKAYNFALRALEKRTKLNTNI